MHKFTVRAAALAAATFFSLQASAQGLTLGKDLSVYANGGISMMSGYSDASFGLKLGAESSVMDLAPFKIGATAFYAYTGGSEDWSGWSSCSFDTSAHSFAAGPTANFEIPSTGITLQGRAYASYTLYRHSWDCSGYSGSLTGSGSEFDIGYGATASYKFTDRLSLRVDYDSIGWHSGLLSVGVSYKF